MTAEKKKSVNEFGRFAGSALIAIAVLLAPFYLVRGVSAVSRVLHSPFSSWTPILLEVIGNFLKFIVMLKFGFYFKNYAKRRECLANRKKDALVLPILVCLLSAVLAPWYIFLSLLPVFVFAYFWEIRDIRTDENNHTHGTTFSSEPLLRKPS